MPGRAVQPSRAGTVPWPDEVAARYVAKGYWEGRPLGAHLLAAAREAPEAICLVDNDRQLSYRDLMSRADGAALRLRALGIRTDDRILIQLPNCWEFVVLTLACLRLGAIPVMALPAHRRREIAPVAERVQAKAIAVPGVIKGFDYQAMAHQIAEGVDGLSHILVAGDHVWGDSVDLRSLCEPAEDAASASAEFDKTAPDSREAAVFLLSGGTTGAPKIIARTHDDLAYMVKRAAQICHFGPDTVYLAALPLGHGFPLIAPGILGTLMAGGRVVIVPSPAPERAFAMVEREHVTVAALVPAAVQRWLEQYQLDPSRNLSSLRLLQIGGARLPDHIASRIRPVFGCAVQQVYGMSEGFLCLTRLDDPDDVVFHTQGRPICPDDEILVLDDFGRRARVGEPGALLARGPYTPRGYYRAEDLNTHAFTADGWYRTGDIVRQLPDGNLVVSGRDKDVINRGGEKISAEEIENFAYQTGTVSLAAVVGMPDAELGERVCLYVVPLHGKTVSLENFRAEMVRADLARFKLPERLVVLDSLPHTTVGKVDKKVLRADIRERISSERAGIKLHSDPAAA